MIVLYCPMTMTRHLLCIPINKAPVHVQSYCAVGLKLLSGLNLITKGSLLPHITIKYTCAAWCN